MNNVYKFLSCNLTDLDEDELITIQNMILSNIDNGKITFIDIKELMFNIYTMLSCDIKIIDQNFITELQNHIKEM